MKLNLGSGDKPIDGYENIDRKQGTEVFPLKYEDESIDEIRASHILEHFPQAKIYEVLKHWVSKLKIGGTIKISVPDFRKICDKFIAREQFDVAGLTLGGQVDENDYHKSMFDPSSLAKLMRAVGLEYIKPWKSELDDCAANPISTNLMGKKVEQIELKPNSVVAAISMPRLAFTANMFSAIQSLAPLGIELIKGTGVYWDHVLTRAMDIAIHRGAEIIITIDYDTWFTEAHIKAMIRLLHKYPEADAICPPQVKREKDELLVGTITQDGKPVAGVGDSAPSGEWWRVSTAHFGMTFFRVSALAKLKKPWFLGVPDPSGGWGDGRQDPDIYFWNNWNACGLKLFQANNVPIGHLQLLCTFPGTAADKFKPIHCYMQDVEMGRIPQHCIL